MLGRTRGVKMAAVVAVVVATGLLCGSASAAATPAPTLRINGNHFADSAGRPMRLFAIHFGTAEETCVEPIYDPSRVAGVFSIPTGDADFAAIRSWHANAIRVSLNEQCWLGVNPVKRLSGSYGIVPLSGAQASVAGAALRASYRATVAAVVARAHRHGLAVVLDLHWSASGKAVAYGQWPLPDRQYSIPFWRSVASAFKDDRSVAFEIFNEPYLANPRTGALTLTWRCLRDGCVVPNGCADCGDGSSDHPNINDCGNRCPTETKPDGTYRSAGTQVLVDTIRSTGARQPILVPGRDYTNDLGQWLQYMPRDPLHQIAATFHNYQGLPCDTVTCWNQSIATVAARVPVVTTEFGGDTSRQSDPCPGVTAFDNQFMNWADAHGVSYAGFAWDVDYFDFPKPQCSYDLLDSYNGTPRYGQGQAIHDHFVAVAPA